MRCFVSVLDVSLYFVSVRVCGWCIVGSYGGYLDKDHVAAGFGQGNGHLLADAAGAASDEGGCVFEREEVHYLQSIEWK